MATSHGFLPSCLRKCYTNLMETDVQRREDLRFFLNVMSVVQLVVAFPAGCEGFVRSGVIATLIKLLANHANVKFATRAARTLESILRTTETAHEAMLASGMVDAIFDTLHRLVQKGGGADDADVEHRTAQHVVDRLLDDVVARVDPAACEQADEVVPLPAGDKALLKMLLRLLGELTQVVAFGPPLRNQLTPRTLGDVDQLLRKEAVFGTAAWTQCALWLTDFANAEPNLVNVMQEAGLVETVVDVIRQGVPATSEVLLNLPSLMAALVLNQQYVDYLLQADPFKPLLAVLTNPKYLSILTAEAAASFGTAVDELWRHQPRFEACIVPAILTAVDAVVAMGQRTDMTVVPGKYRGVASQDALV